ncbi:MAG TPA: PIG-L family deacetylase [Candidatus Hydrogenedentes bacterium]|nr:PIG-L family deacetylase [Candidatus Hydrogenedentota bacterium]HIJ74293.1 PIG-L family deacetylase [Candidatus Hydrogenedentota bacterium]
MNNDRKTVLAVGAHPDDVECYSGGTMLRLAHEGWRTVVCVATNGDKGHETLSSAELAQVRAQEANAAAEVLGAELIMLGFEDGRLEADITARDAAIDVFRRVRPDLVITHPPEDYHPDHLAISRLVADASYLASAPLIETGHPPADAPFSIWLAEPYGGLDFVPERFMDITPFYDRKLEALGKHGSQLAWMRAHDGRDLRDMVRIMAEFRGLQSGVKYAEAFRTLRRAPHVQAE